MAKVIWIYSEDLEIAKQLLRIGGWAKAASGYELCAFTDTYESASLLAEYGAEKIYTLGASRQEMRPESVAAGLAEFLQDNKPSVFFIGGTPSGKETAAKIAALLDIAMITDATKVDFNEGFITQRMMYGGLAVLTERLAESAVVTIPPKAYEAAEGTFIPAEIITAPIPLEDNVEVLEVAKTERPGADIGTASKIVCVGRGLGRKEDLQLAWDLAKALDGEVGCTRGVAEDYHWLPEDVYIGLSGQKVRPELYLSMGVSGQVQHVAGIRDSKIIVAVDINENAPIFEAADYGIVGDLYEVIPALTAAIAKNK